MPVVLQQSSCSRCQRSRNTLNSGHDDACTWPCSPSETNMANPEHDTTPLSRSRSDRPAFLCGESGAAQHMYRRPECPPQRGSYPGWVAAGIPRELVQLHRDVVIHTVCNQFHASESCLPYPSAVHEKIAARPEMEHVAKRESSAESRGHRPRRYHGLSARRRDADFHVRGARDGRVGQIRLPLSALPPAPPSTLPRLVDDRAHPSFLRLYPLV